LRNTSEVGFFKILSEESVSAGTRRITALTGLKAVEKALNDGVLLQSAAAALKVPAEELSAKIEALTDHVKKLQKQLKTVSGSSKISVDDLIAGAQNIGGIKVIAGDIPDADVNSLRQLIDQIRQKTESAAILFSSVKDDKVTLVAGLSRDLTAKGLSAVDWVKSVTPLIGGKGGGGRADMAQSGGTDASKLPEAFAEAKKWFEKYAAY
jgi:alanyl-tRNA synthetase